MTNPLYIHAYWLIAFGVKVQLKFYGDILSFEHPQLKFTLAIFSTLIACLLNGVWSEIPKLKIPTGQNPENKKYQI
jgi:hypothetical protein